MLGLDDGPADSRIFLSAGAEAHAVRLLERHGLQRFAVLAPGTQWETKHWLPERFAEVGRGLRESDFDVLVLGTKRDGWRGERIAASCPGAINLCGETTPGQLAALIKRAAVCVTNDSGPMHLAVALGTPMVCVFGPTNPVQIGPYGHPEAVARVDLACSPCNFRRLSQCPHGHACMQELSAKAVVDRIASALRLPRGAGADKAADCGGAESRL